MATASVNGRQVDFPDDDDLMLVDALRDRLGLTGTKIVCGSGVCGACAVLVDGEAIASCLAPAKAMAGRAITTIEGIGGGDLHPVQRAFLAQDAMQCGFCTPGFIVEAKAFYDEWRAAHGSVAPPREAIGAAFAGHLCRCGAYDNIYRAVADACAGLYEKAGEDAPRIEARDKATGAAVYSLDIRRDGQLEGAILRSAHARARVAALDLAPAEALPGVKAAVSLLDASRTVTFVGDPVAAVAAVDRATAERALAAIRVEYEPLPAAIGPAAAMQNGAPVIFPRGKGIKYNAGEGGGAPASWRGNLRGPVSAFSQRAGAARKAIDAAREAGDPLLYEAVFRTGAQQHNSLEPHVAVACFEGDDLIVEVSTQAVSALAPEIAKKFKLDPARVRVRAQHVGGGFGSKGHMGSETIAAVALAQAARAPVKVAYSRHEELSVAGYRPAVELKLALLPARDGIEALSLTAYSDSGVAANNTVAGLARLIYKAEARALHDYDIVSDLPPGSAFRGPGGPPMAFALEQAVDEAALRLGVDPLALRRRWDANPARARLYDWAMSLDVWKARGLPPGEGRFRRGVGAAAGYWLYLWQTDTQARLAVQAGRLVAELAVQDIGTGTRTVIAETLAREFGLEPREVEVRLGDSRLPVGPGSGGSRVTASIVPALLAASGKLKARLKAASKAPPPGSNAPWRDVISASPDLAVTAGRPEDGERNIYGHASLLHEAGLVGRLFGWMLRRRQKMAVGAGAPSCVQVVEVEVDTWLGRVRVTRAWSGISVGKLASRPLARNQAAGAFVQSLGHALYEGREIDLATGHVLTVNLDDYRTPGIADMPPLEVHFDETGFDHVAGNSVGIGEVAAVPTPAALANAIHNAIGLRPTEIPLRPDRLLALLKDAAHVA